MNEQLLPCPFCGSEAEMTIDYDPDGVSGLPPFLVGCTQCPAIAPEDSITKANSKEEGIKIWNSRYFQEGCTPEDAIKLREANHALAAEKETFESLLTTAMELIREQGFEDEFFIRRGKLTQ